MPKIVQSLLFVVVRNFPRQMGQRRRDKEARVTAGALDFELRGLYGGLWFPSSMSQKTEERVRGEVLLRRGITDRWTLVRIQAPDDYTWTAGQHLSVFESARSASPSYYSIASARCEQARGQFDLLVSEPSNLFAPGVNKGDPLWLGLAQGGYPLERLEAARLVVLIAMGTGIAPLRAVAQHLINLPSETPEIRIVHGVREPEDAFLEGEFLKMGKRVEFFPVVSRSAVGWPGRAGRVQAHLEPLPEGAVEFCVCGSQEMVQQVRGRLFELGAREQCIHSQWG